MREMTEDKIYKVLVEEYDELLLDYVLLSCDEEYFGSETHKKAVIEAISALNSRVRVGNSFEHLRFLLDESKMLGTQYSPEQFFHDRNRHLTSEGEDRTQPLPEYMTYWQAFSDPPYGVPYSSKDFHRINALLFPPEFRNDLEIYSWNDDFSNYFDDGKEWWGTALWSVYDKHMKRFVIIGASLTD